MRQIFSLKDLKDLPVDSIVGKGDDVYQRIFSLAEKPAGYVWAGINFELEEGEKQEYYSDEAVWHILAECYDGRHPQYKTCADHEWCSVYYECRKDLGQ